VQYIRRYGIYSSRGRGLWSRKPYLITLAAEGQSQMHCDAPPAAHPQTELSSADSISAWVRLIAKVYEVDALSCRRCGFPMRVLALITDATEVKRILRHLVNIGRPPPGFDPISLN
jgi:hypothetical protein